MFLNKRECIPQELEFWLVVFDLKKCISQMIKNFAKKRFSKVYQARAELSEN